MDAGCGSGTASLAAILLGMNAYAFDDRQHCVDGTIARLTDWTNHLIDSDMAPPEQVPPTIKKRKSPNDEDDDDDGDLLEEGDVGDDDEERKTKKPKPATDEEIEAKLNSIGDQDVAVDQEESQAVEEEEQEESQAVEEEEQEESKAAEEEDEDEALQKDCEEFLKEEADRKSGYARRESARLASATGDDTEPT